MVEIFASDNAPYNRAKGRDYLLWLDLETTGSEDDDYIIEIGAFISDRDLNEIESRQIVLPMTSKMEEDLPEVVRVMHTVNGLIEDCHSLLLAQGESLFILPEEMLYKQHLEAADKELTAFVKKYNGSNHMPLAGSGVSHFDRKYIKRDLPNFNKRLTHFSMDIGGVRRWMEFAGVALTSETLGATLNKTHRALDDARVHRDEARRWIMWAQDRLR